MKTQLEIKDPFTKYQHIDGKQSQRAKNMAKNRKISNNMVNLMNVVSSPNAKNTTDT